MSLNAVWSKCAKLLQAEGIAIDPSAMVRLERYTALLREWNKVVSLVSKGDLDHLWERHIADSLSLARHVREAAGEGVWLDVGSGGGVPVVPVKVVLPEVPVCLVERSERKVGFLHKVFASLELIHIEVAPGIYPDLSIEAPSLLTARAIEKPETLVDDFANTVDEGAVFLCQSGKPVDKVWKRFHVEHIEDAWTKEGLRRGELWRVSKEEEG